MAMQKLKNGCSLMPSNQKYASTARKWQCANKLT